MISREKKSKKKLGEKLVKMLGFCQNWIFGQMFDYSNSVYYSKRMNYSIYFQKRQDKIVIWELTNCGFQCNYPAASPASPLFHSFAMLTSWQSLQLKIMSSFILMSLKIMSLLHLSLLCQKPKINPWVAPPSKLKRQWSKLKKLFENHRKKSHSTLRAKRATFTF